MRPNHRRVVAHVTVAQILAALADPNDSFALQQYDDELWFRCPVCCEPASSNGGSAHMRPDGWRWACSRCRHHGTIYELQQLVLADADALDRLMMAVAS